jgi:acetoin:2,6-dichlorophenolindophenol oxidoreductase subunit beta
MHEITYAEALREALREEMARDENVIAFGIDVVLGFLSGATRDLIDQFGKDRVRDTPISEQSIIGLAVGASIMGMRPVPEIQFNDLITLCMDQIVNQAAKLHYMSGGKLTVPLTIRTCCGILGSGAAQHSQSLEAWFIHVPGLTVVAPSTPAEAKGLLKSSIRDDNPVLFFENKRLYKQKGPVPDDEYLIPLRKAHVVKAGTDVTLISFSYMLQEVAAAAEILQKEGIEAEIIDLRTLSPLDKQTILNSIRKTSRVVIVEEGCRTGGVGAELSAIIAEEALEHLDAPIKRVAALDTPMPFSPPLEKYVLPNRENVLTAVRDIMH